MKSKLIPVNPERIFLSVVGKDQPGIIAGISKLLYAAHCNLEDNCMTILDGAFAMIMVLDIPSRKILEKLKKDFEKYGNSKQLKFFWEKIDRKKSAESGVGPEKTYLIQLIGPDQTGLVYKVSQVLAAEKLNIFDLNSKLIPNRAGNLYGLVLETRIASSAALKRTQKKLALLAKQLQVEIKIKPVETIEL